MGYVVRRFWSNDVLTNTDGVLVEILALVNPSSAGTPSS
jgi:very-short-patch-repair endonuclease